MLFTLQGHSPVDKSRSPPGVLSRQSTHVGASGCYSLRRGILLSTSPGRCQVCQPLSLKLRSRPALIWVLRPLPNWQAQLAGLVFLADQSRSAPDKFTSFSDVTVSTRSRLGFLLAAIHNIAGVFSRRSVQVAARGILLSTCPGRRQVSRRLSLTSPSQPALAWVFNGRFSLPRISRVDLSRSPPGKLTSFSDVTVSTRSRLGFQ